MLLGIVAAILAVTTCTRSGSALRGNLSVDSKHGLDLVYEAYLLAWVVLGWERLVI